MYGLNMDSLKVAQSEALEWNPVQEFGFPDNYTPVMALAQNHIHFLDVEGDGPGNARIFVIHCEHFLPKSKGPSSHVHLVSYLQPQIQGYTGDKTFPAVHGQTTSFFKDSGVQQEFAFIPDDFSATYVINVEKNSTQTLPPPTVKDTKSFYVAGITSLVQLDPTGAVYFLPYTPDDSSSNTKAAWSNVKGLGVVAPPNSGESSTVTKPQPTNTVTTDNDRSSGGALSSYAVTSGLVGLSVLFAVLGFL